MTTTFLINSFNRASLLRDALYSIERLAADSKLEVSVVLFEAGSTDESNDLIREFAGRLGEHRVAVIQSKTGEDSSFAAGLNRAAELAIREFHSRYLVCFETDNYCEDARPLEEAIRLLEAKPDLGGVGFTVLKRNGEPCGYGEPMPSVLAFCVGVRLADWFQWRANKENWEPAAEALPAWTYCDIVYTSPLVIRVDAWLQVDGMDADTFPFAACDLDLAARMRARGWRMAVIQASCVFHDNLGQLSAWSAKRAYSFHQGTFRFLLRHRGPSIWVIVPLLIVRHSLEWLLFLASRRSWSDARVRARAALLVGAIRGYP